MLKVQYRSPNHSSDVEIYLLLSKMPQVFKTININSLHGGMVMTYRPMNRDLADGAIEPERSWIRNLDFKAKQASAFCDIPPFWQIASKQMFHKLHWLLEQWMISLATQALEQSFHRFSVKCSTDLPSNSLVFGDVSWDQFFESISGLESQISSLKAWNPMKSPYPVKKKLFTSSSQVSVVTTIGVTGGLKTRKGIMKQSLVTFLCSARPSEIMPFFDWLQIFKRF